MDLTLEQALRKGIEAHKAGKVQEADQYYTAILNANPKHPDANHNMGVLAVGIGKVEEALPFFKIALDANQNMVQYWISYIDALIKLDRSDNAKAVFEQAEGKGIEGDDFDRLKQRMGQAKTDAIIDPKSQDPPQEKLQSLIKLYNQNMLLQVFTDAQKLTKRYTKSLPLWNLMGIAAAQIGKLDDAILAFQKTLSIKPDYADSYNNMGIALNEQGKHKEAIAAYNKALSIKPEYAEAHNNMGVALKYEGKRKEAIVAYTKALSIKPEYAEAHNNMGVALNEQGKSKEAIAAYNKALSIKPEYAEAYNNMGNAFKDEGKLEEAIAAYEKALSIKPEYAEAHNNMGFTLNDQGKLEDALEAYNKAIAIQPNYADAYNNMGITLLDDGQLEAAVKAFNKAILIEPDYTRPYNNVYFPLQALKTKLGFGDALSALYPKESRSSYAKIAESILNYRLHRGQNTERQFLFQSLSNISNADNITIQNPTFNKTQNKHIHTLPDKMIALINFGRSGTGLMHSHDDGHPEDSTLPSIYISEYFDHSTWTKIISTGWDGMIDCFIALYDVLFDAASSVPVATRGAKLLHNIGIEEGMTNVGDKRNEVLSINKKTFRLELSRLMALYEELDASIFFKLVHAAFDKTRNDQNPKGLIFYHIHNPDNYALLNFSRFNPNTKWIMMVREPIQSCESWIRTPFRKNDYFGVANTILTMLFEIDNAVYLRERSIGVRLEDLKTKPRETMPALCKWMGVDESESLYEMTVQGKKWWGDPSSIDYKQDGHEPFGQTSIKRKVGSVFSENDQFILRTLLNLI